MKIEECLKIDGFHKLAERVGFKEEHLQPNDDGEYECSYEIELFFEYVMRGFLTETYSYIYDCLEEISDNMLADHGYILNIHIKLNDLLDGIDYEHVTEEGETSIFGVFRLGSEYFRGDWEYQSHCYCGNWEVGMLDAIRILTVHLFYSQTGTYINKHV